MEDMKVASYDSENKTWTIEGPFPKYDYSPLTNKDKVKEGANITHWSKLKEGEISSWHSRLQPLHLYSYLRLEVDKEHDEMVYKALLHAMDCIVKVGGESIFMPNSGSELGEYYETLCDLQAAMDGQIILNVTCEVFYLLGQLYTLTSQIVGEAKSTMEQGKELDTGVKNLLNMIRDRSLELVNHTTEILEPGKTTITPIDASELITPAKGNESPCINDIPANEEEVTNDAVDN